MVKIIKKDYPWIVRIEDKIGKNSGKPYQAIALGFIEVKDKDAKDPKNKYKTSYFNFFDERDLLKLASAAENSYQRLKYERDKEKEAEKGENQSQQAQQPTPNEPAAYDDFDDDIPFD